MKEGLIYLIVVLSLLGSGCTQTRYAWDGYDQKLYNHYQNPDGGDRFSTDLKKIITNNESSGRVPPGIYAEYGYTLYEKGQFPEAIEYFKKEQEKWPESNVLMSKMINNSQQRQRQNDGDKTIEVHSSTDLTKESF